MSTYTLSRTSRRFSINDYPAVASDVVKTGLITYLAAFNESSYPGTGTMWYDLSGNNNHGTLGASVSYDTNNGGEILFNGTAGTAGSIALANANSTLTSLSSTHTWTVSFWINPNSYTQYAGFVVFNNEGPVWTHNQNVGILVGGNNAANSQVLPTATWTFVTAINNNGTYTFYFNTTNTTIAFAADTGYGLGGVYAVGLGYSNTTLNSKLGMVLVYNRVLDYTEIVSNFNVYKSQYGY